MRLKKNLMAYEKAWNREWLLANGLGGYASSTIIGANTRKYHGLLVAAQQAPAGRRLLVTKLEESVTTPEGQYQLSTNKYPDNTLFPTGWQVQQEFRLNPLPTFYYSAGSCRIKKKVFMIHGTNAVVVRYSVTAPSAAQIKIAVLLNDRDIYSLTREKLQFSQQPLGRGALVAGPASKIFMTSDACRYKQQENWYYDMVYDWETMRGEADREHHFQPGVFELTVQGRAKFNLLLADRPYANVDFDRRYRQELERTANVVDGFYLANRLKRESFSNHLALAADQFVVGTTGSGEDGRGIMAGYHWFGVWGRDAAIALPGLTLTTGRFDEARRILMTMAGRMKNGLVPNFVDEKGGAAYNSADASLWFVLALYRYLEASGDEKFAAGEMSNVMRDIIEAYATGANQGIAEDRDGLIKCGPRLTWMDAGTDAAPFTPREGKPVEINALWYNCLRIAQLMSLKIADKKYADVMKAKAEKTAESFLRFWNEAEECLFDTLDPDDPTMRPNQIFAVSLPAPLLDDAKARKVVEKVKRELLTPLGLRTLSPHDARYIGTYGGSQQERDRAYHNGVVWPWLIGPFVDAYIKTGGRDAAFMLSGFRKHMRRGGLGTISELVEPKSMRPDGCIAQAWSVGEVLRAYARTHELRS
ncbi:Amylo-alpha-1,6-glucosidase [Candidatus Burarchaeum australiense]|nr:Amylo-alpha-1,6-glucosidase [Candidatus Burarchaeum australiense]